MQGRYFLDEDGSVFDLDRIDAIIKTTMLVIAENNRDIVGAYEIVLNGVFGNIRPAIPDGDKFYDAYMAYRGFVKSSIFKEGAWTSGY